MDKSLLLNHIVDELTKVHQSATDAATRAYETATHEENAPEHKYDTLSLEASYLAHGQAQRVAECEDDLAKYAQLKPRGFSADDKIGMGCLVLLIDDHDRKKYIFLGPAAGGLKLTFNNMIISIVTPSAPLGKALLGRLIGDEIEVIIGQERKVFDIVALF